MSQPQQTPSIGRIVHYLYDNASGFFPEDEYPPPIHCAAIITEVDPADPLRVGLAVFTPSGLLFLRDVDRGEHALESCTWHWPEYVPAKDTE